MEENNDTTGLKRFFIFPRKDGTKRTRFPTMFYPLRFQQKHLPVYRQSQQGTINPDVFRKESKKAFDRFPEEKRDSRIASYTPCLDTGWWVRRLLVSLIGAALVQLLNSIIFPLEYTPARTGYLCLCAD